MRGAVSSLICFRRIEGSEVRGCLRLADTHILGNTLALWWVDTWGGVGGAGIPAAMEVQRLVNSQLHQSSPFCAVGTVPSHSLLCHTDRCLLPWLGCNIFVWGGGGTQHALHHFHNLRQVFHSGKNLQTGWGAKATCLNSPENIFRKHKRGTANFLSRSIIFPTPLGPRSGNPG